MTNKSFNHPSKKGEYKKYNPRRYYSSKFKNKSTSTENKHDRNIVNGKNVINILLIISTSLYILFIVGSFQTTEEKYIFSPGGRIGAICADGSRSGATGRGACSWHGGVKYWITSEVRSRLVNETFLSRRVEQLSFYGNIFLLTSLLLKAFQAGIKNSRQRYRDKYIG